MLSTEQYQELKANYLETIVSGAEDAGGLPAHIAIFGTEKKALGKSAIVFMKINDEFMSSENGKDFFIEKVVPALSKDVTEKFDVHSVAWASEGWLREMSKDQPQPENYKDLPIKKEVVIVNIESLDKTECVMYDVIRQGHKVASDGSFIDSVVLTLIKETNDAISASGRFTGLIKHFTKA